VDAVVTGSINQQQNTLIIRADLVQVSDGTQIWGQQYNRNLSDILAVQSDISKEISDQLRLKLSGEEQKKVTKQYTQNTEAYQLYLKGRYYWNKRTQDGLKKGIDYFEQAVQKDPKYALAYAALADCYIVLVDFEWLPPGEVARKANEATRKALSLDDSLAEAHTSNAGIKEVEWNWQEADNEYKRAIELNPNYATAHHWYSLYSESMGRLDVALTEIKKAQELDPLSIQINKNVGDRLISLHQYDKAIEQYRKTIEMDPNSPIVHEGLGFAYLRKGLYAEALAEFQKGRELSGDYLSYVINTAEVYARWGKKDEVQNRLHEIRELSKQKYVSPLSFAGIYATMGEKDQAFEWLEKAYQERSVRLEYLKIAPQFESLRTDSRYADLLRRIGLPQ
jgi:eukaryotic-like serine/threonine-protein kinase